VIRQEKGRGQYAQPIYVYEAMIPPVDAGQPLRQTPAQSSERPMCQPPAQLPDRPMHQPPAGNVPIDNRLCANSPNPLRQPPAQIHSETSKNPVLCASRTDPGSQKDRGKDDPKSIECTAAVIERVRERVRKQRGMSDEEARRERKYDREIKAAGLSEELDE
jgi:hypothetical protein